MHNCQDHPAHTQRLYRSHFRSCLGLRSSRQKTRLQLSQDPWFGYLVACSFTFETRVSLHSPWCPETHLRLSWPQPPSNSDIRGMSLILRIQSERCYISTCKSTVRSGLLVCLLFQSSWPKIFKSICEWPKDLALWMCACKQVKAEVGWHGSLSERWKRSAGS